jgi:hypothetical protein
MEETLNIQGGIASNFRSASSPMIPDLRRRQWRCTDDCRWNRIELVVLDQSGYAAKKVI